MIKASKILYIIVLPLIMPYIVLGGSVTFVWDPNSEPDLAGYRLYQSDTSMQYLFGLEYAVITVPAGSETATIEAEVDEYVQYWVLTAYDQSGNESAPSNEVTNLPFMGAPGAPGNFRINIVGN